MEHTFLWQEGVWQAKGIFYDDKRKSVQATGQMEIQRLKEAWIAESFLEMNLEETLRITNRYKIDLPVDDGISASWTALNMAMGPIQGNFVILGDTIFSIFKTLDGQNGSESFRKIDDNHYHNKGFLLENNKVVSSWEIEWKKNSAE